MVTDSSILGDVLSLVGGMVGGGLTTIVIGLLRLRQRRRAARKVKREAFDPIVDSRIDEAAAYWAATHDKPEAQGLVANKLHLAYRLAQQRQLRRWSR
jgi:hypothetical protein